MALSTYSRSTTKNLHLTSTTTDAHQSLQQGTIISKYKFQGLQLTIYKLQRTSFVSSNFKAPEFLRLNSTTFKDFSSTLRTWLIEVKAVK